jgi:glycosyltransferase involved in cell wall biosynthesis
MAAVARLIRAHSPQIVLAIEERPLLFSAISRRLAGSKAKLVSVIHKAYLRTRIEQAFHLLYRPIVTRVDAMVYVSQNQRKLWEGRGFLPPRSVVIRNGVDPTRFSPQAIKEWRVRTRAALGFEANDYVIGMCARFRPEKNHRQLVDALGVLRSRGHPVKALLIGDGPTRGAIERYSERSGLRECIVFVGHQEDVRRHMSAFDIGVLCSLYEAAPVAALEMMSMGLPVVLSDVGGAAEIVLPGQTGFLFPVGDTIALASSIEELSDPMRRKGMGRAAAEFVAANFAVDQMLARYRAFLNGLLTEDNRCAS